MPSPIGNLFMRTLIQSPLHPIMGKNFAVITLRGRKTGKMYSTPVNVVRDGDAFTIISLKSRTWWRNLRGDGTARLHISGRDYTVKGSVIEQGAELVTGLAAFFECNPGYARYFRIQLGANGLPVQEDLERAAGERVIVRLAII